jgi:hypothetical protein
MRYVLLFLSLVSLCAFDSGQYGNMPDNARSWFKGVRSPHGVPCCDVADGFRVPVDFREPESDAGSTYWVLIAGKWRNVSKGAVIYEAGNPLGEAITWYVTQGDTFYIRCFVPGPQT